MIRANRLIKFSTKFNSNSSRKTTDVPIDAQLLHQRSSLSGLFPSLRISSAEKQLRRAYLNWSFGTRRRKSDSIKHNAIESQRNLYFFMSYFSVYFCAVAATYQDDCVRFISHVQIKKRKLGACKNSNKIKIDFNKQTEIADSAKSCFLRTSLQAAGRTKSVQRHFMLKPALWNWFRLFVYFSFVSSGKSCLFIFIFERE